jgi:hypothetical protein
VYVGNINTDRSTAQLHKQGEEPTLKLAYVMKIVTTPTRLKELHNNTHNTHAARYAAQITPKPEDTNQHLLDKWTTTPRKH